MRLLFISDDNNYAKKLKVALCEKNYAVDIEDSLSNRSFWSRSTEYDGIIISHSSITEIIAFTENIRKKLNSAPILVILESLTTEQAIELFSTGIDDYASKFHHLSEIVMRMKALLRRGSAIHNDEIIFGDLTLNCSNYTASRGQKRIHLTKKEFGLLEYLLRHQNQVLSRTDLIEHVWDIGADLFSNSLETHILNLRRKIEAPNHPKLIHTISGRGYKIAAEP